MNLSSAFGDGNFGLLIEGHNFKFQKKGISMQLNAMEKLKSLWKILENSSLWNSFFYLLQTTYNS